ncbi:MAG TPA: hypothetical protein VL086_21070, partial [Candidatus Nitrosotalea sp.]|nr:hypothetical protein [Candidatus Nitrosotalea sp.]
MMIALAAGLTLSVGLALSAKAEDYGPFKTMSSSAGEVLTDAQGMTLYTYDKDTAGKSNCTGECAEYWPP